MRDGPKESITIAGQTYIPEELRLLLLGGDGVPWWLLAEATASVALSRDERAAQTITIED